MPVQVRAFAKINLGLYIGPRLPSGFHELRTVYQTLAVHDLIRVSVSSGAGIEIRCKNPNVPRDETNTCWRVAERFLKTAKQRRRVVIQIDKKLPVQGGLGAGSSNAVATLLALERECNHPLSPDEKLTICSEVGSDLPLFLVGGTVLGIGRGEQVLPLPDLPPLPLVLVTPGTGVSTPEAFAAWDTLASSEEARLTGHGANGRIEMFSRSIFSWLAGSLAGVPAHGGRGRAEKVSVTPLLDLVRAGIENDFERVVFPQYPELREVKRVLEREGARYASLSGSGSALYGLFDSVGQARRAAAALNKTGLPAQATTTLPRAQYWREVIC